MGVSRVVSEPGYEVDALPYGIVDVDRDGIIRSYRPFHGAAASDAHERMIGQNFFSDVVPYPQMQRFHERFWSFVSLGKTAVEPFEFVFPRASGDRRVSVLFVREEDLEGRVSIVVMKNGALL